MTPAGCPTRTAHALVTIAPWDVYHLPKGFWLWLDSKIYVNHEQGSDTAFVLEGEFGKVVTANVEVWLRG